MSRDDFNDRLKRIGATDRPPPRSEPQAPARPKRRPAPEASMAAQIGRIGAGIAGFLLGSVAAIANSAYRDAIGTTAEADLLFGLVIFMVATGFAVLLLLGGLASLIFGKRWWGLWAFVGGYLAAFGIAGFVSDFGSLGAAP